MTHNTYIIVYDLDNKNGITRHKLKTSYHIPFKVGILSEFIPASEIIESKLQQLTYSAFNEVGLLRHVINVGVNGHYYFEVRPGHFLSNIYLDPPDVELNLIVNTTSFLYQLINHSETRTSISITGQLKKDSENFHSRICENLDDIGWRKYFLEKMLIGNRYLPKFNQYPKYLNAKQVASLLQVSVKTIRNWTSGGKIPHKQINGTIRYVKIDIEKWVED